MTEDTTNTAPELAPAPETTTQAVDTALNDVRHDSEVAVHHGLAHLEAEFVTYATEAFKWSETEAKAALAWVAAKI